MKLLRSIVVLSGTSAVALCSAAHGNSTPVTRGTVQGGTVVPVKNDEVAVVREKLDVEIAPVPEWRVTPKVTVSAEYVLRHEGTTAIELEVGFPMAGQFKSLLRGFDESPEVPGLGYEVTLDDVKLDAAEEALPLPPTARTGGYDWHPPRDIDEAKAESARLTAAFTRWVAADPELEKLLQEYSRIAPPFEAYDRARAAVNAAEQKHDPAIDRFRATLAEQQRLHREAHEFAKQRIRPHLEARYDLRDFALRRLLRYLERAYNPHRQGYYPGGKWPPPTDVPPQYDPPAETLPKEAPDLWLVAQIDPEIDALRRSRIAEADALLDRYGFDATFLSPLTGKGYSKRVGWRDDSTWDVLGFEPPTGEDPEFGGRFTTDDRVTHVTSPRTEARLIRFAVPMQPGQVRTLRVTYSALAEVDASLGRSSGAGGIAHFRYILTTARNWKSFGTIDLTVTLPSTPMVVIDPPPQERRDLGDGRVQYSARIVNPDRNLRLAYLPSIAAGQSYLFNMVKADHLEDLRKLEAAVEHPQAKQVLQALVKAVETKRGS